MKTDLSSPVATADFSKFAGILSATVSQHHLPVFEIAHYLIPFSNLKEKKKKSLIQNVTGAPEKKYSKTK